MNESSTQSPRFNPSRAGAQRVRIDRGGGGGGRASSDGRSFRGLAVLLLCAAILGGAYWAHREGYIAIPGLNEVLARAHLGGRASTETLLAPGAEPLAPLRYAWTDGFTISSVVTIEPVGSPVGSPAGAPPARGLRAEVDARFGSTTSEGQRFIAFDLVSLALTEPGADAAALADLQASLAPVIEGFQGTLLASERGELERVQFDFPGAPVEHQPLFDELARTLAALVVTFPADPVGLGGRWRTGTAEHELVELDDAAATVATTLENGAALHRQAVFAGLAATLDSEGLPAGDGAGAGTWRSTVRPR